MNRVLGLLASAVLGACSATGGFFGGDTSPTQPQADASPTSGVDASGLSVYLQMMDDLVEGDQVTQAEVFQSVSADAAAAPNTTNRLKLALALAIPGHAGSNAEHAQQELRELLAQSEVLLPEERVLAAVALAQTEQRLLLDLEVRRLQTAMDESIQQQNSDAELRLRALEDENKTLRTQLEDTQQILDEITNIERSIRERERAD
jgi:hypothetical protein